MRFLKANVGMIVVVVAIIWAFVSVWLSANQVIRPVREGIGLSYLFALFGTIYHWTKIVSKSAKPLNVVLAVAIPICAFITVRFASRHANEMFSAWKMQSVSQEAWSDMISDLERLPKLPSSDQIQNTQMWHCFLRIEDLPPSFSKLGRPTDFQSGELFHSETNGRRMVSAQIWYGGRYREWGLVVGSNDDSNSVSDQRCKRLVRTNAWFFVSAHP
jgi:hypothetical protein